MFKRIKYLTWVSSMMTLVFLFLVPGAAWGQDLEDTSLEAFFDHTMNAKVEEYHIPNASVAVVKDGEVVYKKGFGWADIENHVPVDADNTLFRIGSTSKLITWTAVMQLVEAGKLDLDTDINEYLDFEISPQLHPSLPKNKREPITMTHLMTHTAGFEDYPEMLFRLSPDELLPLQEYVKDYQPSRIFPAGEVAAYSNYGTALAGYIVERVSGLPFSEYVEKNIFTPLNMHQSSYQQPPILEEPAHMAQPYRFVNGSYKEAGFEYIMLGPAGSMSSTASDMANFMIAHLSGGAYNGERILQEETVKEMHKGHFTYDPTLGGMTLGFMEGVFNQQKVLFHGGSTMLYNTGLYLIPEANTGIFISCSGGSHLLHSEVFQDFMDSYYPAEVQAMGVPAAGSRERAEKYTGEYHMNRKSLTTDEKIVGILTGGFITVDLDKEGYLLVSHGGETNKFVEIEPAVYENLREGRSQDAMGSFHKIIFKEDPWGQIMLTTDGPMTYSKAPIYSTLSFTALSAISILFITLISLIYGIIIIILAWLKKEKFKMTRFSAIAYGVGICSSITILVLFSSLFSSGIDPVYQLPQEAYMMVEKPPFLDSVPILMWIFSFLLLCFTAIAWWKGLWGRLARVHYSIFTLAVIGLMWMLNYWNLLT